MIAAAMAEATSVPWGLKTNGKSDGFFFFNGNQAIDNFYMFLFTFYDNIVFFL